MTVEGTKHECTSWRQSTARALPEIEATDHSNRGEPSTGGDDRRDRLDGAFGAGGAISAEHLEECCGTPAAITRLGWGDDPQGDAGRDVARVGGPYSLLRTGTVRVRINGDRVEPGFHDVERLCGADGRGGPEANQRIRSEVGGGGEAGGSERRGSRHDGTGGGDPLSERDGTDVCFSDVGDGSVQTCGKGVQAFRIEGEDKGPSGPRESAGVSAVRQRQIEGGEEQDGGPDGDYPPGNQPGVVASRAGAERLQPAEEVWHRGEREIGSTATDDGPTIATDSVLAEDGICRSGQNHQSANSRAVLHCPRQGWKSRGVWAHLGHHPTSRRLSFGPAGDGPTRASRQEVCREGSGRAHRAFRTGAARLCLRPRWLEQGKRGEAQESGCQGSGPGPPGPRGMGGQRVDQGEAGERAGEGGGGNRSGEKQPIQFPPTASTVGTDDGGVWPNGNTRIQPKQTGKGTHRKGANNAGRMKQAKPVELTTELGNRDQHRGWAERRTSGDPSSRPLISRHAVDSDAMPNPACTSPNRGSGLDRACRLWR